MLNLIAQATMHLFIQIVFELLEVSSKVNQERKRNKASRIQIQHLVQQKLTKCL